MNVSRQNVTMQKYSVTDWIKKEKRTCSLLPTRDSLQGKTQKDWKWGDGKYIFHTNGNDKKAGVKIPEEKKKKEFKKRP